MIGSDLRGQRPPDTTRKPTNTPMEPEAAGQAGRQTLFLTLDALLGTAALLLDTQGRLEHANLKARVLLEAADSASPQARWDAVKSQIAFPDGAAGAARFSRLRLAGQAGARALIAEVHALGEAAGGGYLTLLKDPLALDRFDRELILASERRGWTHQREALMHDLKGILNSMQISLELLSEPDGESADAPERRRRRLAAVKDDLSRMDRALRALPGAEGGADPPATQFDVGELVREIFASLRQMIRRHHVELDLEVPQTALALEGRRSWLRLALFNVAVHRLGAMRAGGRLTVAAVAAPEAIEITFGNDVADLRAGMIDPAFRAPLAGRFGAQPNDLDLQVARLIVEAHGGEMQVATRAGGGTGFTLQLPRTMETLPSAAEKFSAGPVPGR